MSRVKQIAKPSLDLHHTAQRTIPQTLVPKNQRSNSNPKSGIVMNQAMHAHLQNQTMALAQQLNSTNQYAANPALKQFKPTQQQQPSLQTLTKTGTPNQNSSKVQALLNQQVMAQ